MPPIPRGLGKTPKRRKLKAAPPPSREAMLRKALVLLLKRLGLIGTVVPTDMGLLTLAQDFAGGRREGMVAMDQGKLVLSPPNPALDRDIPF